MVSNGGLFTLLSILSCKSCGAIPRAKKTVSVIEDVEETLVQFLLPKLALRGDTNYDEGLVGSGVDVHELSVLGLEVSLASAFWIVFSLVKLVGHGHVHLHLDSSQVNMIVFVANDQILIAVVPEKRVGLHLDDLVLRGSSVTLSVVLEALQVIQLHWDNRASLWVLDLKSAVQNTDLQPVVSVELGK